MDLKGSKIALGIHGASGRMGKVLKGCILEDENAVIAYEHHPGLSLDRLCELSKVVIDFSSGKGAISLLAKALEKGTSVVICSTGFSEKETKHIEECAQKIPVLKASNASLGARTLEGLAEAASKALSSLFSPSILDIHHKHKKDSPSGTAIGIKKAVARGGISETVIQMASLRVGEVVGEHRLSFFGPDEELILVHKVTSRKPFALGAIAAAKWLENKSAGRLYSIKDVFDKCAM